MEIANKIIINKFKRIGAEIEILDFGNVNYFVGKNGSGKTSILNAITYLNDGLNSKHFFNRNSKVEFHIGIKNKYIVWNEQDPNKTSHSGNMNLTIYVPKDQENEKGANGVSKIDFSYREIQKFQFEKINDTLSYINQSPMKAKRVIDNDDPWDSSIGKRKFYHCDNEVNPDFLASGVKSLNKLRYFISSCASNIERGAHHNADAILIIIEEPENNLHPDLQKVVPKIFHDFIDGLSENIRSRIHFFISTHSPFIISAASNFDNSKFYLLDEGLLIDKNFTRNYKSSGLNGGECAQLVSVMLGCNVTDLGYPENYCILEEYSLQVILESAKSKGFLKNIQFVSASGMIRAISISETIREIENLNTLVKCNPYYFNKYFIIVDNVDDLSIREKDRIDKIKTRIGNRFKELGKKSIEDYYKNISIEIFNQFKSEVGSSSREQTGLIKYKFAELISNHINSREDFSKLFDGELDFLLTG